MLYDIAGKKGTNIMAYALIIFSALLTSLSFIFTKMYQKTEGTSSYVGFRWSCATGIFTIIIFLCINGFSAGFTPYSFLMAFLQSAFTTLYTIVSLKLMKMGTVALYTLFLMTGGMIVPYFMGLIFLDEPSNITKTIGLIVTVLGVVMTNFSKEKINLKQLLLCILVFFLNGGVSAVSKLHQVETTYETVGTVDFIILMGIARVIFSLALIMFLKNKKEPLPNNKPVKSSFHWIYICICTVIVTSLSSYIQLDGARTIDASIIYPIITGGTIIFTALSAGIFFREKITKNVLASIILCTVGIVLFSM